MGLIWAGGEYEVTAPDPRRRARALRVTSLETPAPTVAVELRAELDTEPLQRAIDSLSAQRPNPSPEPTPIWVPALMAAGAVGYLYALLLVVEETFRRLLP